MPLPKVQLTNFKNECIKNSESGGNRPFRRTSNSFHIENFLELKFLQLILPEWNQPEIAERLAAKKLNSGIYFAVSDPFDFDNVGFTKSVVSVKPIHNGLRYLSCADCDLAPLGVQDTRTAGNLIFLSLDCIKLSKE